MENYDSLFTEQQAAEPQKGMELSPFDVEEYKQRKQKLRDDTFSLIEETVEKMKVSNEPFQAYLDVQARFDRYSVNNAILIAAQMPTATKVADFDTWKSAGVFIKKGEEAICLLEPGKEYTKEDGSVATGINVKKVFDISQTTSRQKTTPTITRDERLLLKSLISNAPCEMEISAQMSEKVNAVYRPDDKKILVRQGMDAPAIFRALTQELAHAHFDKGENYRRSENAVAAYCVSYVLCKRYGVSVDTFRFEPMPQEFAQMDSKAFRAELGKIRDVAGEISRDMSRVLETQERTVKKDRAQEAR